MFDDFTLGIQCEEVYNEELWEKMNSLEEEKEEN